MASTEQASALKRWCGICFDWRREENGRCSACGNQHMRESIPAPEPDDEEPIPWFTEKDAQQALERMHAWASASDPLMRLVWDLLDDTQRMNLARVAFELRPRGDA